MLNSVSGIVQNTKKLSSHDASLENSDVLIVPTKSSATNELEGRENQIELYDKLSCLDSRKTYSTFAHDDEQKVLVKCETDIRIMTYNVHGFKTKEFKNSLKQIVTTIGTIMPDILVLEEVYVHEPNEAITPQQLVELFKRHELKYFAFSKTGINAVFSKFPFDHHEIDLGEDSVTKTSRNAIVCRFRNIDQNNDLTVVGTHLDVFDDSGELRKSQVNKILDYLKTQPTSYESNHVVITGDFNSLRRSDYTDTEWKHIVAEDAERGVSTITDVVPILEANNFEDSFHSCAKKIIVSVWSNRRIDYIFGHNIKFSQTTEHRVVDSDHYPVYADISL